MVSLAVIHQIQQSTEFRLDMARMLREEQAEERVHIEDELRKPSCCVCGKEMKSNKNAACGWCRA